MKKQMIKKGGNFVYHMNLSEFKGIVTVMKKNVYYL